MDILNNARKTLIYILVAIVAVVIIFVLLINTNVIHKKENVVYKTDNFLVDIDPKIDGNLNIIKDNNISNIKSNLVKITNNGTKNSFFKIVMSPIVDDNFKVAINDSLTRDSSKLKIEDDKYVIYEAKLSVGYTSLNEIKLWITDDVYKDKNYNFELEVIEKE